MDPVAAERAAVEARRALLRQQAELLAVQLPWLSNPDAIPAAALGASETTDLPELCFGLATWIVAEIVLAASRVQERLDWSEIFDAHQVPRESRPVIGRTVLEPATRYAPGIAALAEIVAVTPLVAAREGIPASEWGTLAKRTEGLGAKISCDGTHVQVLVRNYLSKAGAPKTLRALNAARFRLDDQFGITSVTPIGALVTAAREATLRHLGRPRGVCVAMQAEAPPWSVRSFGSATVYGAVWSAYASAAARLIFPRVDVELLEIPPQEDPDPDVTSAFDRLAQTRALALKEWADGLGARGAGNYFLD